MSVWNQDKLQKEQRNTAVNLLKLNEGWRTILRQTRAAELRKDISILSQTFERQLDGLDSVIKVKRRSKRLKAAPHPIHSHFLFVCFVLFSESAGRPGGGGASLSSGEPSSPAEFGAFMGSAGQTAQVFAAAVGEQPAAPELQVQLWEVSLRSHSTSYRCPVSIVMHTAAWY